MKWFTIFMMTVLVSIGFLADTMASVWYVGPGMGTHFRHIQEALDDSEVKSGDRIVVLPGMYQEAIEIRSDLNITLCSAVGPERTIIMRPLSMDKGPIMTVLIKGASSFEGFTIMENPLNQLPDRTTFTLSQIPRPGQLPDNTAGITATGPAMILYNRVSGHRMGILQCCPSGTLGLPVVRFNEVAENDIGIVCCESPSLIRDNIVENNKWVGIVSAHASSGEITNNLIIANGSPDREDSAGILCWQSYNLQPTYSLSPVIYNNTIHNNLSDGIRCVWEMGGPVIPVISGNIVTCNDGYGISCLNDSENEGTLPIPIIRNCNIWGNGCGNTYQVYRITTSISEEPLFQNGYFLHPQSPCKDSGDYPPNIGTTSVTGQTDLGRMDLGYHYLSPEQMFTDSTSSCD